MMMPPPPDACRKCGTPVSIDEFQPFGHLERPKPGDAAMCLGCGSIWILNESLKMRGPNEVEQSELDRDPKARLMRRRMNQVLRQRQQHPVREALL